MNHTFPTQMDRFRQTMILYRSPWGRHNLTQRDIGTGRCPFLHINEGVQGIPYLVRDNIPLKQDWGRHFFGAAPINS
jgi:hypothetical protein